MFLSIFADLRTFLATLEIFKQFEMPNSTYVRILKMDNRFSKYG